MPRRGRMRGRGFWDFIKKAGAWLKKTGIISKIGKTLGAVGVPYAGAIGSAAGAIGYGRRRYRRRRGGALGLPGRGRRMGGALKLAGMR